MSSPTPNLKPTILRAGAGAGKTTELTKRVLDLAESYYAANNRFPRIVVTTFTRKATQELRERLMLKALERQKPELFHYVQKPTHLHISTIHGVLSLFLSKYASFIGMPNQFQMLNDKDERFQIKKTIRELIRTDQLFADDMQVLLEAISFQEIVSFLQGYISASDSRSPLDRATEDDQIAVLTAELDKICNNLKNFRLQILDLVDDEKWQAFAAQLKVAVDLFAGESDSKKKMHLIKKWYQDTKFPAKPRKIEFSEQFKKFIDDVKKKLNSLDEYHYQPEFFKIYDQNNQRFLQLAVKVNDQLEQWKNKLGLVTMSDLEKLALQLMETPALDLFSSDWDYWMIDEFQDTSPVQIEILQKLIMTKPYFLVGDPQQSIYLFRGARSEIFSETQEKIKNSGGDVLFKQENFRSRPPLLHFFNDFFRSIDSQFQSMQAGEKEHAQPVEPEVAQIFHVDGDRENEIAAVIYRCQELHSKGVPFEDICVLTRKNEDLRALANMAKSYSLPVILHTAGQFYDRREVCDALSLLKFLINPHDNLNLLQVLRSPFFKIDDQLLVDLTSKTEGSFWFRLNQLQDQHDSLKRLAKWLKIINTDGLIETWIRGMISEGYFDASLNLDTTGRREANLWKLISIVKQEERKPGFTPLNLLAQISLTDPESQTETDAAPVTQPRQINLMTVNASKGLQFPYVIIFRMGVAPHRVQSDVFTIDKQKKKFCLAALDPSTSVRKSSLWAKNLKDVNQVKELAEHWRFLYVAMTRAEMGVSLIWSDPKENSWASQFNLKSNHNYQLNFRQGEFVPQAADATSVHFQKIRPKWLEHSATDKTQSVTTLLETSQGYSFEKSSANSIQLVKKAVTGVQIHKLFESLKYKNLSSEHYQKELNFIRNWNSGLILRWIDLGFVEWGFAVQNGDRVIPGQIDLWCIDSNGEVIVADYKTGSPIGLEKAYSQLKIYAWALHKMKKIDLTKQKTKLVVIYPRSEKVDIREAPSLESLEKELPGFFGQS